jgi:DUF1365 family protein
VEADGEVILLTLPRVFFYAFNPVSFWFCLDRNAQPRAVLAEVNNTFAERHGYLCFHADHRPIQSGDCLEVQKIFHVSPFMETKGSYRFRFGYCEKRIRVAIDLYDDEGLILATSITGKTTEMTIAGLLRVLLSYPLQTLKVVVLIHYQAVKLVLKGVKHYPKPPPPLTSISH